MVNLIEIGTKKDIVNGKVKVIHSQWIDNFSEVEWERGNKTYKVHQVHEEDMINYEAIPVTLVEMKGVDVVRQWEEIILEQNNILYIISPIQEENESDEE